MTLQSLSRWKAFGLHLAISVFIAAIIVTLVVALWYPRPYFAAMGGEGLLRLLIGVDVVLGPIITLIIFDPTKRSLRNDLAIVALVQIAALAYGGYVMFEARPVYNVFVAGAFHTVPANSIDADSLARADAQYRPLSLSGPRVVGARFPTEARDQVKLALDSTIGGPDIPDLPHLYVPYAQSADGAARASRPLVNLAQRGSDTANLINKFVAEHASSGRSLGYVPVKARNQDFVAVVDRKSGELVGYLPINP